jgi:hypothetical protein
VRASLQTAVSIIALSPHFNTFHHAFFILSTIDEPKIVKKTFSSEKRFVIVTDFEKKIK